MVYSAFAKDAAWSKFDDKNENLASSKKIFYSRKTVTDQKGKFPIQMVIILGAGIWGGIFPLQSSNNNDVFDQMEDLIVIWGGT